MATYSLTFRGASADNAFAPQVITMDDAYTTQGGQSGAMANGASFFGRVGGQDAFYKLDAERSDPSRGIIFLLRQ